VSGAEPRIGKLVQQGLAKALENAGFASNDEPDVRLDLRLTLDRPKDGVRTVRVAVSTLPRGSANATLTREFKTTLSEPVDDGQWRALGEGAVYKVATDLATRRITQASLRMAQRLKWPVKRVATKPVAPAPGQPLPLRLENALDASVVQTAATR
jgi:predicted short-subunit dehydrogenase-like oxidoreductase (DUF2520 family)